MTIRKGDKKMKTALPIILGLILLLLLALNTAMPTPVMADDTGAKYPQTVDTTPENPNDDIDWTSAGNVKADDSAYAAIPFFYNENSYVIRATNFGFNIPSGSTINGIKIEIERKNVLMDQTSVDAIVQMTKDGTTRVGNNYAETITNWPPLDTIKAYGGTNDLWGTTWTYADINASTFGVHFAATAHDDPNDISVDFVRITVYYTQGVSQGIGGEVRQVDRFGILLPWIVLASAMILVSGAAVLVARKRKAN
jgi:hypothetical protein